MALEPLATLEDLEARLGRDLTSVSARAEALLRDASAKFRAEANGQEINRRSSTVRATLRDGRVRLSQVPVVSITSVEDIDGDSISYEWDGRETLTFVTVGSFEIEPIRSPQFVVDVTYVHGYEFVPDDVIATVCQIAGRALGQNADETGLSQETIGSYSYSVGGAAAAGPLGMLADERSIARRYRRSGQTIWLR